MIAYLFWYHYLLWALKLIVELWALRLSRRVQVVSLRVFLCVSLTGTLVLIPLIFTPTLWYFRAYWANSLLLNLALASISVELLGRTMPKLKTLAPAPFAIVLFLEIVCAWPGAHDILLIEFKVATSITLVAALSTSLFMTRTPKVFGALTLALSLLMGLQLGCSWLEGAYGVTAWVRLSYQGSWLVGVGVLISALRRHLREPLRVPLSIRTSAGSTG